MDGEPGGLVPGTADFRDAKDAFFRKRRFVAGAPPRTAWKAGLQTGRSWSSLFTLFFPQVAAWIHPLHPPDRLEACTTNGSL